MRIASEQRAGTVVASNLESYVLDQYTISTDPNCATKVSEAIFSPTRVRTLVVVKLGPAKSLSRMATKHLTPKMSYSGS